jgi:hypothetical protein
MIINGELIIPRTQSERIIVEQTRLLFEINENIKAIREKLESKGETEAQVAEAVSDVQEIEAEETKEVTPEDKPKRTRKKSQ